MNRLRVILLVDFPLIASPVVRYGVPDLPLDEALNHLVELDVEIPAERPPLCRTSP
jgi:hypothetical protein